jgi:hypothetical protein
MERFTDDAAMVAAVILLRRQGMKHGDALDRVAAQYRTSAKDVDRACHVESDTTRTYMALLSAYSSTELEALVREQQLVRRGRPRWRRHTKSVA